MDIIYLKFLMIISAGVAMGSSLTNYLDWDIIWIISMAIWLISTTLVINKEY